MNSVGYGVSGRQARVAYRIKLKRTGNLLAGRNEERHERK